MLRAGLLRYLSARPDESFDVESLMQTFGRLRLDVENCVRELVDFGVAQVAPGSLPPRYMIDRPAESPMLSPFESCCWSDVKGNYHGAASARPAR